MGRRNWGFRFSAFFFVSVYFGVAFFLMFVSRFLDELYFSFMRKIDGFLNEYKKKVLKRLSLSLVL